MTSGLDLYAILWSPSALAPLCGAVVQLAAGLYLAGRPGIRALRLWFLAVTITSAAFSLGVAGLLAAETAAEALPWARLQLGAGALAGAAVFGLSSNILGEARRAGRLARLGWLMGAGVVLLGALLFRPGWIAVRPLSWGGMVLGLSVPVVGVGLVAVLPIAGALWRLRGAWRALPAGRRRRQLAWCALAQAVALLGGLDALPILTGLGYPIAWATATLSAVSFFYAVAQHRLMAVRTFFRRSLLEVVAMFAGLAAVVWLGGRMPWLLQPTLLTAIAVVVVLFLFGRLWVSRVEPLLDRWIDVRQRRAMRAIADFDRRALGLRDPHEVERLVSDTVERAFGATVVELRRYGEPGLAAHEPEPRLFPEAARRGGAILGDLLDDERAGSPTPEASAAPPTAELRSLLRAREADAWLPLVIDGKLRASVFLAGGVLRHADDWTAAALGQLAARAALAWNNATLYAEVGRRSAGLEAEVRQRTMELEEALGSLRAAQARLVETERSSSLALLVAGISHEINNALNFIYANLPTLTRYVGTLDKLLAAQSDAPLPAEITQARLELPRAIEAMSEATRRTRGVVADLRRFARPDSERRVLLVEEGIEAALNLMRRRTAGRVTVERSFTGSHSVEGYPGPLNQCFFSLLLEAAQAARAKMGVVLAPATPLGVRITIWHDGAPREQGTVLSEGMSLSIARAIVARHGGTLQEVTEPGTGFAVWLPPSAPPPTSEVVGGEAP